MKAHILIVEDEAILYERLRRMLVKENYTVATYTPSVAKARNAIQLKQPDLVLLDIELEGSETGLDLGKELSTTHIPFIYVTQLDDNQTFYKGLATNHEHFIIKTKPRLDTKAVLRAIETALHKKESHAETLTKEGVLGLVGYLEQIKKFADNQITKVPVPFQEIAFFSVKPFINEDNELEEVQANYLWFQTNKGEYYFLKTSLKTLLAQLPSIFCRINESVIVNLNNEAFHGRITDSIICVGKKEFVISNTYKSLLKKKLEDLYFSG